MFAYALVMPVPPQSVRSAARRGLDLRSKYSRGGTATGIARARDLANGSDLSMDTIGRMRNFFGRHSSYKTGDWKKQDNGEPSNGWIAHLLWGGDAGEAWVNSKQFDEVFKGDAMTTIDPEDAISLGVEFTKRDDERRLVFGFAKFAEDPAARGHLYIDRQDDVITPADLEDAAYEYVLESRDAGEMHVTKGAATLVESFMVTPEKLTAMGLPTDAVPQGWWVGYKVHEDDAWARIKDGTYTGFSVEGFGFRDELPEVEKADDETVEKLYDEPYHGDGCMCEEHAPITDEQARERRDLIQQMFRASVITEPERDRLLAELPAPAEYRELTAEQMVESKMNAMLGRIREAMGLDSSS